MKIEVFDNIIDYNTRNNIYVFCKNSNFKIGWEDSDDIDKRFNPCLYSDWNQEDLKNSLLFDYLGVLISKSKYKNDYNIENIEKVVCNLSKPGDVNFLHTHKDHNVILYYVNLDWNDGYYGETVFTDNQGKENIFTSNYVPGRFILFDGTIPHSIRPQSFLGPKYRFTVSIFFTKPEIK